MPDWFWKPFARNCWHKKTTRLKSSLNLGNQMNAGFLRKTPAILRHIRCGWCLVSGFGSVRVIKRRLPKEGCHFLSRRQEAAASGLPGFWFKLMDERDWLALLPHNASPGVKCCSLAPIRPKHPSKPVKRNRTQTRTMKIGKNDKKAQLRFTPSRT